jgi:multidrug resistance protein MdtO
MATAAQSIAKQSSPLEWFIHFVKQELAPYPGRTEIVARTVIAATLVMIVCETLRVPFAWQGAIYAFLVSRESPSATLRSATTIFLVTVVSAACFLLSASLVINLAWLHFLWVIGSFFLGFYAVSIFSDYIVAVVFVNMISAEIPLWDHHVPAEFNVERTIWLCFATLIAIAITMGVEIAFSRFKPGDEIIAGVAERLTAIQTMLASYAENNSVDQATEADVVRLSVVGTSILRRALRRSSHSPHYAEQMGAIVALTGRLVDIAANLKVLTFRPTDNDRRRLRELAGNIAAIRSDLLAGKTLELKYPTERQNTPSATPLLVEMEKTVALIPEVTGSQSLSIYAPRPDSGDPPRTLVVRDAFTNIEHIKFAAKGCLAASLCYIIFNVIDWPGISTAVTTCFLTALSTVGASRQKQLLRLSGAVAGGFLIGMGSQMFILPYLDSIAGFTILFILVTALASWFATSSPRLSYFGIQMALAFYLINLEEFAMQTSLAVARDRVVGILLGLTMMWIVFDQLWGASGVLQMRGAFVSTVRLLAQFAKEPLSPEPQAAIERSYSLREQINQGFDRVRALADGVLFEFGPSRNQGLLWRGKIREWQPQLRLLFITEIALWKYRAGLPGFELPPAIAAAQRGFDDELARALEAIADRIEGRPSQVGHFEEPFSRLERSVSGYEGYEGSEPQSETADRFQALLSLQHRIESLATSLQKGI